jgi:hypothetical protein
MIRLSAFEGALAGFSYLHLPRNGTVSQSLFNSTSRRGFKQDILVSCQATHTDCIPVRSYASSFILASLRKAPG